MDHSIAPWLWIESGINQRLLWLQLLSFFNRVNQVEDLIGLVVERKVLVVSLAYRVNKRFGRRHLLLLERFLDMV